MHMLLRHKKKVLILSAIVVLAVGYLLLSPLWRTKTLNEASPIISDSLEAMDSETRNQFNEQTEIMRSESKSMQDGMPDSNGSILARNPFVPRAHEVGGEAVVIKTPAKSYVRFEDFKTVNGPDLRIYISKTLSAEDYVDLGAIKATDGNINYEIPANINIEDYKYVMVWCRAFSVLFSYAPLQ